MDPTQCYLEMFDAMQDRDFATARERAESLRDWLDAGGFYPPEHSPAEVRAYLAKVLRSTGRKARAKEAAE